jgi:Flp pilus assembly CpaF family ATPase
MDHLVRLGMLTRQTAPFLEGVAAFGLNVLVARGTQASNTSQN